jgi:hypothetical protein
MRPVAPLFVGLCLLVGCSPEIGDDCSTSVDCSANGDRICDSASPGGYCTVIDCEEDTCPDGAVCVEFRFEPERLASSWCMASCGDDSDCRNDEGYSCVRASSLVDADDAPLARVIDEAGDGRKFCVAGE